MAQYLVQSGRLGNGALLVRVLEAIAVKWMPPSTRLQLLRIAAEMALLPNAVSTLQEHRRDVGPIQYVLSQLSKLHRGKLVATIFVMFENQH